VSESRRLLSTSAFIALLFGALGASALPPQAAAPAQDTYSTKVQPLLAKYCFKCHGPQLKPKADLNLGKFASEASIRENRKVWKEVLTKTLIKEMPPDDAQPQPTQEERDAITKFIEVALNKVDASAPKVAGRVVTHRLNRIEYRNTVRDLLGVDFPGVSDFPHDDVGYGFDNIGDVLSMPPLLLEKYVAAARKIADQAVTGKEKDKFIFTSRPKAPDPAATTKAPANPNRDAAKECLTKLSLRAFRRTPQPDEVERLLKLYDVGEKMEGGDFEKSMKLPIRGLLISPYFLLRVEAEGFADAYPLQPFEVASRMSYFLWCSMPDDELLDLAKAGKLMDAKTLEAQAVRMMKDPKALAFAENFTPQWLQIRRLEDMRFDATKFPSVDASMKKDMIHETVLFFEAVMREDLSVLSFLDADFTFVNDRLARLYGVAGGGGTFQKVKLTDPRRGGVLTMAAVLAATSDPDRTSLVKRGKWVLETILATPPPPPVPDAANLKDDPETARLPLRLRMEKHRADPNCASCHKRMDPIGFGFENYDAIGAWRDQDQGKPVDSAAELPDGKKFNGPIELKRILKERKSEFVEGLVEKMLTFALGRGVEHYDGPAVKGIADAVTKKEYKFSALVVEILKSYPFLYRQKDRGKK
jgi:mono/diheme cytochrome c family protein